MRITFPIIILTILLTAAMILPGCTRVGSSLNGSGKIIDKDVDIADFENVEVNGTFNLEIIQSASFQVTLSTDENLISRVSFSLNGKTLKIKIEAPATFFPTSLKIKIGMPQIHNLNLAGEAKASISGFKSLSRFNLNLTDASILTGNLEAEATNFYLSKGSQLNLQGKAKSLELDSAGASKLELGDFILASADVKLREASTATLHVNGEFDVILKDASKIIYLGNPLITNTSITADSTMTHK